MRSSGGRTVHPSQGPWGTLSIQRRITRIFRGVEWLLHQEQPQRPGLSSPGKDVAKDGRARGPPSGMGRWVGNDCWLSHVSLVSHRDPETPEGGKGRTGKRKWFFIEMG